MNNLTKAEKSFLSILVITMLILIMLAIYFNSVKYHKNEDILNNKIHIIHTGGEIEPKFQENYAKSRDKIGKYDMFVYNPLITSSDIVPNDWNDIAKSIKTSYELYDSFVVICGKDTLPYTASAISLMLENLNKPVIITSGELTTALLKASTTKIPEVMVLSQNKLLRGCRTICGTNGDFESPLYPELKPYNSLKNIPSSKLDVKFFNPSIRVIVVKVFPGIDDKYLSGLLNNTVVHGIVLETYGDGRGPIDPKFLSALNKLVKKGVVIIAVSQYTTENTDTDIRLLESGVLPGYDMTVPAAFAKLCFLLGNVKDKKLIGKLIDQTFRGEMSRDAGEMSVKNI